MNRFSQVFRSLVCFVTLVSQFLLPATSFAHKRDFVWTYEWFTPSRNEKEIELWYRTLPDSHKTQSQVEMEFALNDRWVVAPYFVYETKSGESSMSGWKLEQRYRFGDFKKYRLLPAAYIEIEKMAREEYIGEAKGIVSYVGRKFNLAANLILEKELVPGAKKDYGYSVGWSTTLSKNLVGGIEIFGDMKEGNPAAGPTFGIDLSQNQRICIGAAFGLNDKAEKLSARLIYEIEFLN